MKKIVFQEKTLQTSKNINISYNLFGFNNSKEDNFRKETLVFLHGLGGDLAAWDEIREIFFKKGYKSVAVDIRGHGISSRPNKNQDYQFVLLANDVLKIINHEKIEEVVLIGHCLGGMIAQQIAIKNSPQIKKLVLIGTSCQPFKLIKKLKISLAISKLTEVFEKYLSKVHASGRIFHRKYVGSGDFNVFRIVNDIKYTSFSSYSQIFSKVHNFDLSEKIPKINIDTLILIGTKDSIFPIGSSRMIHQLIPKSKLISIAGADHMIIFNYPKKVVNSIIEFI